MLTQRQRSLRVSKTTAQALPAEEDDDDDFVAPSTQRRATRRTRQASQSLPEELPASASAPAALGDHCGTPSGPAPKRQRRQGSHSRAAKGAEESAGLSHHSAKPTSSAAAYETAPKLLDVVPKGVLQCPVCTALIPAGLINDHVNKCLEIGSRAGGGTAAAPRRGKVCCAAFILVTSTDSRCHSRLPPR